MKEALLALALALLVNACHRPASNDGTPVPKLVGRWTWAVGSQGGGGATILRPDGTFISESTNQWAGGLKAFRYEGRWALKERFLTLTYLKTSEPESMPVGRIDHLEIMRGNENELALLDSAENRTNVLWRSD